jgi:hypothetical protein
MAIAADGAAVALPNSAIASNSFLRWPNDATPTSLVVVCHPAQRVVVDVVGAEHLGILGEADPAEPTVDVQVQSPWLLQRQPLKGLNHDTRRFSKGFS